jgi:hypothetical protein
MKTYDLYGYSHDNDIRAARDFVANTLGIKFAAHESLYHGGEYYRNHGDEGENFILKRNYDELENEWTEPRHESYPLLLYVNATLRARELERMLVLTERFKLLKRGEL